MNTTIKLSLLTTLLLNSNLFAEEKLEDITVTSATKTSQKLSDVTSNMNVITAQEIEERHYTTVTEALNSLPGVSFTANGGLGKTTSLRLRGMDSRHTLILVDGIRYQDPSNTSGASIQHLIISDIERIEVIKGAQSGIWGADAAAGVINIITKKPKEGINFQASQEFGSFSTTKTNLALSYQKKDFYIKATHTNLDSQSFTSQVANKDDISKFEDDGYSNKTSSIKAGFSLFENGKLELGFTNINGISEYDNTPNDTTMKSDFETKLSNIKYTHTINNQKIQLKHEVSKFTREEIGTTFGVKSYNGKTSNNEISDTINYFIDDFIILGLNKQTTDVDYIKANLTTNEDTYTNKSMFLTNSNKLWNNTTITESIRHDNYNHFDNKTTGKIGIKHITDFGLIATANYGTAYTAPSIIYILNPYGTSNNLQPEKTKSFDISLEHHGMSITYFDQKIDNLITGTYYPATFQYNFANEAGTSKIKGYELTYNATLFDTLATSISYTKLSAENKDGQELGRRANKSIKFGLDYYGVEDLHLGLNGEYVGERFDRNNKQGQQTGKYTVANFTANYAWDKHLSLYGKVDNITDKYYQTVNNYATSPRAFYGGMKLTY